jgi:hypothetical protein
MNTATILTDQLFAIIQNRVRMAKKHTATFVSDYGKIWEINYSVQDGEVVSVNWVSVDGNKYPVRTVDRENTLLRVIEKRINLVEWAHDSNYEARETHHFIDN